MLVHKWLTNYMSAERWAERKPSAKGQVPVPTPPAKVAPALQNGQNGQQATQPEEKSREDPRRATITTAVTLA